MTYDNYGNRLTKGDFVYTWTRGRLLASVNGTTYTYDKDGVRTKKIVNGVTHEYFYDGDKLIAEKVGDKYFYFFYDESGVCGFRYENIDYEYVKNIFGDVIGIYNEYGTHVATYAYDAWGNMTYCNAGTDVAYINPFLYRGYYYDSESGLYYLMTRYYDTQIGRFISPDTPDYLAPDTVGGVDLYAYGLNNPVMYVDPTGHLAISAIIIGALIGLAIGFGATVFADYIDDGEVFNNSISAESYFTNTLVGGVIGGLTGGIGSSTFTFTYPTLSLVSTSIGTTAVVVGTGTAILSGVDILGVLGIAGLVMFAAEHTKNQSPSNRNKHEKGQTQRKKEQPGGEKGDARRPYRKWKRNRNNIVFPILYLWYWLRNFFMNEE